MDEYQQQRKHQQQQYEYSSTSSSSSRSSSSSGGGGGSGGGHHHRMNNSNRSRKSRSSRNNKNNYHGSASNTMLKSLRLTIFPYLPPPFVKLVNKHIDPTLRTYLGGGSRSSSKTTSVAVPEPTMTIVTTMIIAWFVLRISRFIAHVVSDLVLGKAIADDDDDPDAEYEYELLTGGTTTRRIRRKKGSKNQDDADRETCEGTVLLCGPTGSGKTRLFYQLCYGTNNLPTLMSLKANVGTLLTTATSSSSSTTTTTTNNKSSSSSNGVHHHHDGGGGNDNKQTTPSSSSSAERTYIRFVDWPGHAPLTDPAIVAVLDQQLNPPTNKKKQSASTARNGTIAPSASPPFLRIILVLDATQPVSNAANVLDQIFTYIYNNTASATTITSSSSSGNNMKTNSTTTINNKKKKKVSSLSSVGGGGGSDGTISSSCSWHIFIACHKKDFPKAKTHKRIKIQMRTELERILKSRSLQLQHQLQQQQQQQQSSTSSKSNSSSSSSPATLWWPIQNEALELDELSFCKLYFTSSSCEGSNAAKDVGIKEMMDFCKSGTFKENQQ